MFPTSLQTTQPPNTWGPEAIGWSNQFDYDGSNNLIYRLWAPTIKGISAGFGYIQKFTYSGNNIATITWAVTDSTNHINGMAKWADRATLTYA